MSLRGLEISEGRIGQNVAGDGREYGLIGNGVAVPNKLELDTAYTLRRLSDAVAIGINENYDKTNEVNLYRHISEFYRRAAEGKKLHIMLVSKTTLPTAMTEKAKLLALEANGNISDMAFAFNPASNYTETQLDGFNADVRGAIAPLQAFAEWADSKDMPLHTILEGRAVSDELSGLTNLRDLENHFTKVTLVIGQDYNYAHALSWDLGKKFADVGTFLGVIASQPWNRNPGEVETQNLSSSTLKVWEVGGLSNHKRYVEVEGELETLNDKGYVFPIKYQGLSGYWWNDGHVCSPIVLDAQGNMNQHMIYYSHTIDESKRALRAAFLPELKKPVELEKGRLPLGTVGYYNALGNNKAFEPFANKHRISEGRTTVDAASDLLIEKVLNVAFEVVPTGMIGVIKGTINLKNA
ncbi:MAG: DUF2586 family protein [Bacteroidales bacterium]